MSMHTQNSVVTICIVRNIMFWSGTICQTNTNLVGADHANPVGWNINTQGYQNCSVFRKVEE